MTSPKEYYSGHSDIKAGPYDHCIFCGAAPSGTPLTDEHAMPRAIGGRLILLSATCIDCRNITSRFESIVLQRMYSIVLARLSIKSSGAQKRRRKFPVRLDRNGNIEEIQVKLEDYPIQLMCPIFYAPGILREELEPRKIERVKLRKVWLGKDYREKANKILNETGASRIGAFPFVLPHIEFRKLIGKIALCYAISRIGPDGFEPMINSAICGDNEDIIRFVGNTKFSLPTDQGPGHHHQMTVRTTRAPMSLVIAFVRLFGIHVDVPTYTVVVGRTNAMTEQLLQEAELRAHV